jgi:hypothetical protein
MEIIDRGTEVVPIGLVPSGHDCACQFSRHGDTYMVPGKVLQQLCDYTVPRVTIGASSVDHLVR